MNRNLLESLHHDDFEKLAADIKHSLEAHRYWMKRITTALVTRQPITDSQFIAEDAHRHCHFGCWLEKILADELFQQGSFLKIEQYHKRLHDSARTIVNQLNFNGEVDVEAFENFMQQQKEFFDMVMMLFEFSVLNKQQFDPTTQLMNRRSVDSVLANEYSRMKRADDYYCCIAMADIDHFKEVNDVWGHDVGDLLLSHTAKIFNDAIRRHDTVSRYGGEEFLFIFPDMPLPQAESVIERIRIKLMNASLSHHGNLHSVTASFGVTQMCRHCDIKGSIKRADIAMYAAKENGRNCTVTIDSQAVTRQTSYDHLNNEITDLMRQHCKLVQQDSN